LTHGYPLQTQHHYPPRAIIQEESRINHDKRIELKELMGVSPPAAGPGFPLQSFLPQTAKKDFRYNPSRPTGSAYAATRQRCITLQRFTPDLFENPAGFHSTGNCSETGVSEQLYLIKFL
jgi:hypothetical protein